MVRKCRSHRGNFVGHLVVRGGSWEGREVALKRVFCVVIALVFKTRAPPGCLTADGKGLGERQRVETEREKIRE